MALRGPSTSAALGGLLVVVVTVWFLWDLFFAGVELLTLGAGMTWGAAFLFLLTSVLYAVYRYRRYRQRGY